MDKHTQAQNELDRQVARANLMFDIVGTAYRSYTYSSPEREQDAYDNYMGLQKLMYTVMAQRDAAYWYMKSL